jgi:hypothetical protein
MGLMNDMESFRVAIKEVLSQLDPASAQLFIQEFNRKLKELNEQKRSEENSGTSR